MRLRLAVDAQNHKTRTVDLMKQLPCYSCILEAVLKVPYRQNNRQKKYSQKERKWEAL
ncbi:hypothetical protein FHW03_004987 [Ochrobactrum sp. RH2CCR150]|nr:hypothetical protein [Ochrobactrum sp. RH2CCR150]